MPRTSVAQLDIIQLLEHNHLLTAMDILEKLSKDKKPRNKTTVYRTLEKLLKSREICRHSLGSDTLYYELRDHHHDHAVCENCGDITPIACQEKIEKMDILKGFTPRHHHLTVFGLCQSCASTK